MALKLSGYLFTGPFSLDTAEVRSNQVPVVYAIIAKGGESWAPTFRVLEIGFSEDPGMKFAELPAVAEWKAVAGGQAGVYLFYASRSEYSRDGRRALADALRRQYDPPHGFVEA